ncbi:hypothetical protein VE02_10278 [Pseudogymnoascus sp. 03VT05]|nr:hypothetical protein VE02_10278 [Pseudogymnoascus sp. 03VT05]
MSSAASPAATPLTLNRVCCLWCAKRLENEDDVPCVFSNARSTNNPPETPLTPPWIPSATVPAAQALLALQAAYLAAPTPGRRAAVSSAAADLMAEAEFKARAEPKTQLAASLALLWEQRETNRLLRLLLAAQVGGVVEDGDEDDDDDDE